MNVLFPLVRTLRRVGGPALFLAVTLASSCFADGMWSAMGTGLDGGPECLAVDGAGHVYAGGSFTVAGGVSAQYIAKWNGGSWAPVGTGMSGTLRALAIDGGDQVYAGGWFTTAGGVPANYVAKWNGSSWIALGDGLDTVVQALATDGAGTVYVGGEFDKAGGMTVNRIAKWNGSSWSALSSGMNGSVFALAADGAGNLYAGGVFTTAGGVPANLVAKWNGSSWSALGQGLAGWGVMALAVDGAGNLYAGGSFTNAGGLAANNMAKWNGSSWSALGSGLNHPVYALAADGAGQLYAGGSFGQAGGIAAYAIAKWNGSSWSAMGGGMDHHVRTLALSSSGKLYAGGYFNYADGVYVQRIAFTEVGGGCSYSIAPAQASYPAAGGNGSVNVTVGAGCSWSASKDAAWINFTGATSGSGNGSVPYSVAVNGGAARTGRVTVASQSHVVFQAAAGASAEDYFRAGMTMLFVYSDVLAADTNFHQAVTLDANHHAARIMRSVTRCLRVTRLDPELQQMYSNFGVGGGGGAKAFVESWMAKSLNPIGQAPYTLPAGSPTSGQCVDLLGRKLMPEVTEAVSMLAGIPSSWGGTNVSFSGMNVRLDRGDALALAGLLECSKALFCLSTAYNNNTPLAGVTPRTLVTNMNPLLAGASGFLVVTNPAGIGEASNRLKTGRSYLKEGLGIINNRTGATNDCLVQLTGSNVVFKGLDRFRGFGRNGMNNLATGQPVPIRFFPDRPPEVIVQSLLNPPTRTTVPPADPTLGGRLPLYDPNLVAGALAYPAQGAVFEAPASVMVLVGFPGQTGSNVTNVDLFVNGNRLGTLPKPLFAANWATSATGTHTLVARTWRTGGVSSDSAPVSVTIIAAGGQEEVFFNNFNPGAVQSNPSQPTTFTLGQSSRITYLETYHYYNGGALPGTIGLQQVGGSLYGPWPATGSAGQGGVAHAHWKAWPNQVVPAGTYQVVDSHPATWSHNAQSGNRGFAVVRGVAESSGWDAGSEDLGGGWRRVGWWGSYLTLGNNWMWHNQHGYVYALPISTPQSVYFYMMDRGWIWTSSTMYSYMYRFTDGAWLWYQPGSANPRWFLNLGTWSWENW